MSEQLARSHRQPSSACSEVETGCEDAATSREGDCPVKTAQCDTVEVANDVEGTEMPATDSSGALQFQSTSTGASQQSYNSQTSARSTPSGRGGILVSTPKEGHKWRLWSFRAEVHNFIEDPQTPPAKVVSTIVLATIVLSVVAFTMETMPKMKTADAEKAFFNIEVISTIVFTTEYMLRLWVCDVFGSQTRWDFVRDKTNIMDLLAILPFYVDMALSSVATDINGLRVLRSIRLIRLFRVFKLGKYSTGMALMVATIRGSVQAIAVMGFILCIEVVLFSSLAYHAEKLSCPDVAEMKSTRQDLFDDYMAECEGSANGWTRDGRFCCTENNAPMGFDTIIATFWWNVVTVTTVGFGDMYPKTWQGKLVGATAMLVGILVLSLPTGVIGAKFEEVYQESEDEKARIRALEEQEQRELAEAERRSSGNSSTSGTRRRSLSLLNHLGSPKSKGVSPKSSEGSQKSPRGSSPQNSKGSPLPPPKLAQPPPPPKTDFEGSSVAASSSDQEGAPPSSSKTCPNLSTTSMNALRSLAAAGSNTSEPTTLPGKLQHNSSLPCEPGTVQVDQDLLLRLPLPRPREPDVPDALETTQALHKQLREVFGEEILPEAMQRRVDHISRLLAVDYRLELHARSIESKELAAKNKARDAYHRLVELVSSTE